jgi:hypothetical protein
LRNIILEGGLKIFLLFDEHFAETGLFDVAFKAEVLLFGSLVEYIFGVFDHEEDGGNFAGHFLVYKEISTHVFVFEIVVDAVDHVFAVTGVVVPR